MKEIFDEALINRVFHWAAVAGPILGLLAGLAWGAVRKDLWRFALLGLLIGLVGAFLDASWRGLNLLTTHYGPGRIKGYAIYAALFMTSGLLYGTGVSYLFYRFTARNDDAGPGEPPAA